MGGDRDRVQRRSPTLPAIGVRMVLVGIAAVLALAPAWFGQMPVHAAADQPVVTVASPAGGQTVTDNAVAVIPQFKNWSLRCDLAGTANVPGTGHYHLAIDGSLVNMFCGPSVLSLQNIKPGEHTLTVIPAKNDHEEVESAKVQVKFTYSPAAAQPYAAGMPAGRPSVAVLWPRNGARVSGASFPLAFDVRNFRLSCDLMGKQKLANTGHWHVDVDKAETGMMMGHEMAPGGAMPKGGAMPPHQGGQMPAGGAMPPGGSMSGGGMHGGMMSMMSMATMLNMGCNNEFDVPLAGIGAGKHTFFVVLVDNLHEPLEPAVTGSVTVTVVK